MTRRRRGRGLPRRLCVGVEPVRHAHRSEHAGLRYLPGTSTKKPPPSRFEKTGVREFLPYLFAETAWGLDRDDLGFVSGQRTAPELGIIIELRELEPLLERLQRLFLFIFGAGHDRIITGKSFMPPRIGISGWTYAPWRGGPFYPKGLPHNQELAFASRHLNSIEINGTFYSLQRPSSFATWHDQTPDDFLFSVKGGRFITHLKRLNDCEVPLANFFASGVLKLKKKLGPILWQLPPMFIFNEDKLARFFDLLPRDTVAAAELSKRHDERLKGREWTTAEVKQPIRYAMEVRHDSFKTDAFVRLMRKHRIAIVVADTAGKWPVIEDVTADYMYLRLHGDETLYVSGYSDPALNRWAEKLKAWKGGGQPAAPELLLPEVPPAKRKSRDVYVYFDNDVKVRSPRDAMGLAARMGIEMPGLHPEEAGPVTAVARTEWPGFGRKKEVRNRKRLPGSRRK